ncbi:MAG: GDSL-type esterase/lipase family protein [Alphaproteobacteria bacterium]
MSSRSTLFAAGAALGLALAFLIFGAPSAVQAQETKLCAAPSGIDALEHPPLRIRERITKGLPLKIVAIGSSSTFGTGASSPAASYPGRLEAELKARLPGVPVTVLNKGVGGEEANNMVVRFDADVIDEYPDLVLWQVGSNSVLRDHPAPGEIIRQGVERLKASGTEVILINPQYAPKIISRPGVGHSVDVITATAHDEEVGLFDRFSVMRYWVETEHMAFEQFLSPDLLHMNDWSYACVAKLLASAIVDGARPPAATATVAPAAIKR